MWRNHLEKVILLYVMCKANLKALEDWNCRSKVTWINCFTKLWLFRSVWKPSPHRRRLLEKYQKNFQALCIKETSILPSNSWQTICRMVPCFRFIETSVWKRSSYRQTRGDSSSKIWKHLKRKYSKSMMIGREK